MWGRDASRWSVVGGPFLQYGGRPLFGGRLACRQAANASRKYVELVWGAYACVCVSCDHDDER